MEEWVEMDNGHYEVSNTGKIRNIKTKRILKYFAHPNGYLVGHLSINNKQIYFYVHKVVATYFCDNPDKTTYNRVNHIDEDKHNNNANNLEWVTQKQNINKYWMNHPEHTTWNKGLTKETNESVARQGRKKGPVSSQVPNQSCKQGSFLPGTD